MLCAVDLPIGSDDLIKMRSGPGRPCCDVILSSEE